MVVEKWVSWSSVFPYFLRWSWARYFRDDKDYSLTKQTPSRILWALYLTRLQHWPINLYKHQQFLTAQGHILGWMWSPLKQLPKKTQRCQKNLLFVHPTLKDKVPVSWLLLEGTSNPRWVSHWPSPLPLSVIIHFPDSTKPLFPPYSPRSPLKFSVISV